MTRTQKYRNTPKGNLAGSYLKMKERNTVRGHGPLPFTMNEFREFALAQPQYEEMFTAFLESDRDRYLFPSWDRNDNYSLDNITLMTWAENDSKDRHTHRAIRVTQLTKEGEIIATYRTARDASTATGACTSHISSCCSGRRKTAGGFRWQKS